MDAFTNANVMKARDRVLEKGREAGFEMTPMRWAPRVKGIDDLLMSFKRTHTSGVNAAAFPAEIGYTIHRKG